MKTEVREGECKVCGYEFTEYWGQADYFDYGSQTPKDQCYSCYSERIER